MLPIPAAAEEMRTRARAAGAVWCWGRGTSGAIGDGGAGHTLTKTGAGDLTFSATNTFTGPLVLSAGTLTVNGNNTTTSLTTSVGTTLSFGATKTLTLNHDGRTDGGPLLDAAAMVAGLVGVALAGAGIWLQVSGARLLRSKAS